MAEGVKPGLCYAILLISLYFHETHSLRAGSRAKTLHFPAVSDLDDGIYRVRRNSEDHHQIRQKRQSESTNDQPGSHDFGTSGNIRITKFDLRDSHPELLVHWVGEDQDSIICLTRDITPDSTSNSSLYFSYDYGETFEKKDWKTREGTRPIFDKFFHSPADNRRYVFNDVNRRQIWVTTDIGFTFAYYNVTFKPTTISMHKSNINIILAMDKDDEIKRLWISRNFGATWSVIQSHVKSFYWGVEPYDKADVLYVEREEPNFFASILKSENYFDSYDYDTIISGVKDFEVREDYLFASKPKNAENDLDLWVSHRRGAFVKAHFPTDLPTKTFYIADASEEQVFVCVNHDSRKSHLYISEAGGIEYSLSLENIVYYNPDEGPGSDTWLSQYIDEPFAELYVVEGLRGIYMASVFNSTDGDFTESNMQTVISIDKGGEWQKIEAPVYDREGNPITNCILPDCSLHLSQKFSHYRPGSRTTPILSKVSAPGLIVATGQYGVSLEADNSMYVSSSAGANWREVMIGNHFYTFGDHGGIVAAVQQYGSTNEIHYSITEGEQWSREVFNTPEKIMVYGLMTEPGELSTVFSVFGSELGHHSWLLVQVDLRQALGLDCQDEDYKEWWPGEDFNRKCLLGRKTVYKRRITHAVCYNGRDYDRPIKSHNCACTREDFECDVGYHAPYSWSTICTKDPNDPTDPGQAPRNCPEGTTYRRSKGYRRVEGDTCEGGDDIYYGAEQASCPISRNPEFLLYSTRTELHRYLLASGNDEQLPLENLKQVTVVDYDLDENCYFFGDTEVDEIRKFCPGRTPELSIIVSKDIEIVEGLAFDWLAHNIYWVDSGTKKIEVARSDGRLRRTLITENLDQPRSLVLDPKNGIMLWTDWGSSAKIVRAFMDGSNVTDIVTGNIHWPNGLAIDDQTGRIFWTDAYFDRIETAFKDGSNRHVLISRDVPHPFAIAVYKNNIYWGDWSTLQIESANKYTGSDRQVVISNLESVMDIKIFHNSSQQGSNPCQRAQGGCSQLCLVIPDTVDPGSVTRRCLCADGFPKTITPGQDEKCECPDGRPPENGTQCPTSGSTCESDHFPCGSNGYCIPDYWRCDHENDCRDGSDEKDCPYEKCQENQFECERDYKCIPSSWVCDHDIDCSDASDERNCSFPTCSPEQFKCNNTRCIPSTWVCDMDNDCLDYSDEDSYACPVMPYSTTESPGTTCSVSQFTCKNQHCVPDSWRCDGDNDCGDDSDEDGCVDLTCGVNEFGCANGRCIPSWWECDNYDDCNDNSDEQDCSTDVPLTTEGFNFNCSSSSFRCWSDHWCIPFGWKCDGVSDCSDGSDEWSCSGFSTVQPYCYDTQFQCQNGKCIYLFWQCDDYDDCGDNSDENGCTGTIPPPVVTTVASDCQYFKEPCGPGAVPSCVWQWYICDGENDCSDGSDEQNCGGISHTTIAPTTTPVYCSSRDFKCLSGNECVPRPWICDGHYDCSDRSDERSCGTVKPASPTYAPCAAGYFRCKQVYPQCINDMFFCDGVYSCTDGSDETDCLSVFTVSSFTAENAGGGEVLLRWSPPRSPPQDTYYYQLFFKREVIDGGSPLQDKVVSSSTKSYSLFLQPGGTYQLAIAVKVGSTIYQKSNIIVLHLSNGMYPSAPRNFRVQLVHLSNNQYGVSATWSAPLQTSSSIVTYEIQYRISSDTENWQNALAYGSHLQTTITGLTQDAQYSFKIRASNSVGPGNFSALQRIYVGDEALQFPPRNLRTSYISSNSVMLMWDPPTQGVGNGYVVYVDEELALNITTTSAAVSNLCPGTIHSFSVAAYDSKGIGPRSITISEQTRGDPIQAPTGLIAKAQGKTSVNLQWSPVALQTSTVTYEVHYGVGITQRVLVDVTIKTTYTVNNLNPGITYLFWVRVAATPQCQDTPFAGPVYATTDEDINTAPRNLMVMYSNLTRNIGNVSVSLSWLSPFLEKPKNVKYKVYYALNNSKTYLESRTPSSKLLNINFTINGLIAGAVYKFHVSVDSAEARSTQDVIAQMISYRAPRGFKVIRPYGDPTNAELVWQPSLDGIALKLGYAIFVMNLTDLAPEVSEIEDFGPFLKRGLWQNIANVSSNATSFIITDLAPNKVFGFSISTGYHFAGFHGDLSYSRIINFTVEGYAPPKPNPPKPSTGGSTSMWLMVGIGSVVFLVVLLATALLYFVVRHQRLQRSFMSFANSHYDTRSGMATFENNDDATDLGAEDEDQPMIRGFSDDEPLVLA